MYLALPGYIQHGDMLSQVMRTPPPGHYLKLRWGDWETGRWGLLSHAQNAVSWLALSIQQVKVLQM